MQQDSYSSDPFTQPIYSYLFLVFYSFFSTSPLHLQSYPEFLNTYIPTTYSDTYIPTYINTFLIGLIPTFLHSYYIPTIINTTYSPTTFLLTYWISNSYIISFL